MHFTTYLSAQLWEYTRGLNKVADTFLSCVKDQTLGNHTACCANMAYGPSKTHGSSVYRAGYLCRYV